jgi:two-component system sensor histidine kinase DctS
LASRLRGRYLLWSVLVLLVAALLGLLVWLTARYEDEAVQNRLEFETSAIVADLRGALARNLLRLQALPQQQPGPWSEQAGALLLQQRELMRLEWRDDQMALQLSLDSPRQLPAFVRMPREQNQADLNLACRTAARYQSAAYSNSYFVPQSDDQGRELMELCIPQTDAGRIVGYTVAIYALGDLLAELAGPQLPRGHALAFTEADGTRLALHGQLGQGERLYSVQQLLDLPGNTLVVRMQARQGRAGLFPKPLSALVSAMALALALVLALLVRDVRRRQRVEQDLGEALAFRKAMEDSLSTGLRARDLQGRITYVNPAFCKMVGFEAAQLRAHEQQVPYWPPELAPTYLARQQDRHNDLAVLRGGHESVFMRSDGTRFPVLIMEAPLINAQGRHTGWMSAVLDLSEQKRSEELSRASQDRLQASARLAMVGEMASLLSHELNQPLAAIAGYASGSLNILQDAQQRPPADAAEATHLARCAAHRCPGRARRQGRAQRAQLRAPPGAPARGGRTAGLAGGHHAAHCAAGTQTRCADRLERGTTVPARAVRPHHGRAGAAQSGSQRHAGHAAQPSGQAGSAGAPERVCNRRCNRHRGLGRVCRQRRWPRHHRGGGRATLHPVLYDQGRGHGPGLEPVPNGGRATRWHAAL